MKEHRRHHQMVITVAAIYLVILIGTILNIVRTGFPLPAGRELVNGVWAENVEAYFAEHLGFHDTLFRIKSRTDLFFGEKMVQGVYITDDMLLEKLYAEDAAGTDKLAEPVNSFFEMNGTPTFLMLVPSASEVYEGRLPANAVNAEQVQRIQDTYASTANGVRCVDAYHVLSSLKSEYIYYRTDTHWTCYGAFAVYQNAIQKMGFTAVPFQRYVISHLSTEFRGDLYERTLYGGVKPDMLDYYTYEQGGAITSVTAYDADGNATDRGSTLYDVSKLRTEEMYRFYLGEPCEKLVVRTSVESGKRLLLFKDDFADCMVPYLAQHYSEICIVDLTLTGQDFTEYANPSDYSQALFLCSMKNWEKLWNTK